MPRLLPEQGIGEDRSQQSQEEKPEEKIGVPRHEMRDAA